MVEKINAPLGSRRNRFAPRLDGRTRDVLSRLDGWFTEHPDTFVAISGGKDSTVTLDLARRVHPGVHAVFYDSGIEFPQTLSYLTRLREAWGFPLHVYPATPTALDVLEASGQWEHGRMKLPGDDLHAACIQRPFELAQRELGRASLYGLRADESRTRLMLLSKQDGYVTNHDGSGALTHEFLAPIWRWSFEEVHAYIGARSLPLNPLYDMLIKLGVPERRARVGLLVDGHSLDQGRWALTRIVAPDLARRVEARLPALAEFR